ncbi:MAG: cytochrome C assembly family protein [Terriglobales bacterium]
MHSLLAFSFLWARVALGFYVAGLAAAVMAALLKEPEQQNSVFGLARAAVAAGFLFQFVSLVETAAIFTAQSADFYRIITGLLAFIIAAFFLAVYRAYSPRALSLVVVPVICLLAAAATVVPASVQSGPPALERGLLFNGWIYLHIGLIFVGYAGLVVAMGSGVLYLVAERGLKAKGAAHVPKPDAAGLGLPGSPARPSGKRVAWRSHAGSRAHQSLPSLQTLDLISYRSLLAGFPLLTAGLVIGVYWADALLGGVALNDPTVVLALLAWVIYLVLLFARWSAGWRGRRSAYLTLACFGVALAGWFANGLSQVHSLFLR